MLEGKLFKIRKNSNIWLQKEQIRESPTIFREWIKVLKVIIRSLEKYSSSLGYILLKHQKAVPIHLFLYCIPKSRKNRFILVSWDICSKEGIKSLIRDSMYGVPLTLMLQPPKKNSGQAHMRYYLPL